MDDTRQELEVLAERARRIEGLLRLSKVDRTDGLSRLAAIRERQRRLRQGLPLADERHGAAVFK